MVKILYHNITKDIVNLTDLDDLFDNYDEDDIIYKSEYGDASLLKCSQTEIDQLLDEYNDDLIIDDDDD